jgi:hypothetical protein
MPLPISVVVPRVKERNSWFELRGLPSIRENDPVEIIVEDGDDSLCAKRDVGAAKATQPNIIFVEDNILLYEWALKKMLATLDEIKDVSFVYCDSRTIHKKGGLPKQGLNKARAWDPATIADENYVHVTSLLRRDSFPGFGAGSEDGRDLWTTLAMKGHKGLYISEALFEIHETP